MKGEISVLIVCHNYARFLVDCLDSLSAQTYTGYEVILVDDGSTDETGQIASRYPYINYIKQPHKGVAAARNAALAAAQGKYLAFLDADDYWPQERLAMLLAWRDRLSSAPGLVFGTMRNFYHDEAVKNISLARIMASRTQAALPSLTLLPKEFFASFGLFDESMPFGEDSDFIDRLQAGGVEFRYNDATVLYRRLHGDNVSLTLRTEKYVRDTTLRRQAAIIRKQRQGSL